MRLIAFIIIIIIIATILLVSAIIGYKQRKAMDSSDLDDALFRRIDEEWRE